MKLSLNIIIREVSENNFDAECAQIPVCVQGATSREAAVEAIMLNLQSAVLDMRKNKLEEFGDGKQEALDVVSIHCDIDNENMKMIHTDSPEEITKKLSIVSGVNEFGAEAFAATLDLPCDQNYALSLADKNLLDESMKLARNLRRITKIGEPQPEEPQQETL
jgi:hypothetical protein